MKVVGSLSKPLRRVGWGPLLFLLGITALANPGEKAHLFQPFAGFSEEGLKPIFALFKSDTQGRLLLKKARNQLKYDSIHQLKDSLCYCSTNQLKSHPNRRGLFIPSRATLYRMRGEKHWRSETLGALEKWQNPGEFPVIAQSKSSHSSIEFLELAFRPKICVISGLNLMETFLVLFHELVHLTEREPLSQLELFNFTQEDQLEHYYFAQLKKPGGERDAYLAQIQAFDRLRQRYALNGTHALERFLTEKGHLPLRNEPAFLEHLLYQAHYKHKLDTQLAEEIVYRYNRAHSWWTALEDALDQLDKNLAVIEANIAQALGAVEKSQASPRDRAIFQKVLVRWEGERRENRRKFNQYLRDQKAFIDFMQKIDERYPSP